MSRVAKPGSVQVPKLFSIEKYKTVYQMTSTIECRVDTGTPFYDIISALFPCASITGAPKIRTMQIIDELESRHRGIYTGAIGHITPENDMCFNVAIRTLFADSNKSSMNYAVGGGILYTSDPASEYQECLDKSRFLTQCNSDFQLLETFLYDHKKKSFKNLRLHIRRLQYSASHFAFEFCRSHLFCQLKKHLRQLKSSDHLLSRVRLQLSQDGQFTFDLQEIKFAFASRQVGFSLRRVQSDNIFLYHKSTQRRIFDQQFKLAQARGDYDVLFLNENNDVTEASRHNVFALVKDQLITPPVASGCLPGIGRLLLLNSTCEQLPSHFADQLHLFNDQPLKYRRVIEAQLSKKTLQHAQRIFLVNSLRGIIEVKLRVEK